MIARVALCVSILGFPAVSFAQSAVDILTPESVRQLKEIGYDVSQAEVEAPARYSYLEMLDDGRADVVIFEAPDGFKVNDNAISSGFKIFALDSSFIVADESGNILRTSPSADNSLKIELICIRWIPPTCSSYVSPD